MLQNHKTRFQDPVYLKLLTLLLSCIMKYLLHLQTDEEKIKLMEQEEYQGITFIKFLCFVSKKSLFFF